MTITDKDFGDFQIIEARWFDGRLAYISAVNNGNTIEGCWADFDKEFWKLLTDKLDN